MDGRLILCCEVCAAKAVQILYWSDSNDQYTPHFGTYCWFFPEVAIVLDVGQGMDINPEDETSYTTQYQKGFLKYAENEYCVKHRHLPVAQFQNIPNNNLSSYAMASRSGQSSYNRYDLSSNDEEYLMPHDVAKKTPGWSDRAVCLLTAARLCLDSPPELPQNWGHFNLIHHGYHSDQMEICSTFWLPDITDWWRQQEEMHSKYANVSNEVRDIFSLISHGVGFEASFSLGRDVIGWT